MSHLSKILFINVGFCLLAGLGCAKNNFAEPPQGPVKVEPPPPPPPPEEKPICELPEVDYQLDSGVTEFEVFSSNDVRFGFNLLTGLLLHFDLNFSVKKALLVVQTDLREYLKPTEGFAPGEGQSQHTENDRRFGFNIQKVSAEIGHYYKTPFNDLMKLALSKAIQETLKQAKMVDPLWSTVIIREALTEQYLIPAGANAGIQVGDEFDVYNVKHFWRESPCTSEYQMRQHTTESPIATLIIEDNFRLAPNSAILSIKDRHLPDEIEAGAYLYIKKLSGDRPTSLKKSVTLRNIKPFMISYLTKENKEVKVNLTQTLENALALVLPKNGLYIKKTKD